MLVLALLATILALGAGMLTHRRGALVSTTELARSAIEQARCLSVYRGVNHFVVVDPNARAFEVYEDSGTTSDTFDSADRRLSRIRWSGSVDLALPGGPSLVDPLLETPLSAAWSLPLPDSSGRWGTQLRGVMFTPLGRVMSGEASPQRIGSGTMVFHEEGSGTAAVALEGATGSALHFRLESGAWRRL